MNVRLMLSAALLKRIHDDLSRPHKYAAERVGFPTFRPIWNRDRTTLALETDAWHAIVDHDYVDQSNVAACIGPGAFRNILEHVYFNDRGILHVHRHDHLGLPSFSPVDRRGMRSFIPTFFNARATVPHGALVLSFDQVYGVVRTDRQGADHVINDILLVAPATGIP